MPFCRSILPFSTRYNCTVKNNKVLGKWKMYWSLTTIHDKTNVIDDTEELGCVTLGGYVPRSPSSPRPSRRTCWGFRCHTRRPAPPSPWRDACCGTSRYGMSTSEPHPSASPEGRSTKCHLLREDQHNVISRGKTIINTMSSPEHDVISWGKTRPTRCHLQREEKINTMSSPEGRQSPKRCHLLKEDKTNTMSHLLREDNHQHDVISWARCHLLREDKINTMSSPEGRQSSTRCHLLSTMSSPEGRQDQHDVISRGKRRPTRCHISWGKTRPTQWQRLREDTTNTMSSHSKSGAYLGTWSAPLYHVLSQC